MTNIFGVSQYLTDFTVWKIIRRMGKSLVGRLVGGILGGLINSKLLRVSWMEKVSDNK